MTQEIVITVVLISMFLFKADCNDEFLIVINSFLIIFQKNQLN